MDRKTERRLAKLDALEAGGVDSWEWYDESLTEWRKEGEIEDLIDEYIEALNEDAIEAEVDYPAGREAGHSVTLPEDLIRETLQRFVAAVKDI